MEWITIYHPYIRLRFRKRLNTMPVLTRCRSKMPEMDALKASPNPRKLKKAAQKVKASKKKASPKAEELKTPPPKPILKKKKDF